MNRLEDHEAQEVLRLAAERHATVAHDGPTVEGLAQALGLPIEEVQRLLAEVRARRTATPVFVEAPARRFGDRSAALSAGIVLALVLVMASIGGGVLWLRHREAAQPFRIQGDDGSSVEIGPHGMTVHEGGATTVPVAPSRPAMDGMANDALRLSAEELRRELAKGDLPADERAEKEKALRGLEDQLSRSGKD